MAERETIDLLRDLESRASVEPLLKLRKVDMTAAILSSTQAGKKLKTLSKQKGVSEEVAALAKKIVGEWKAKMVSLRSTPTGLTGATTVGTNGAGVVEVEGGAEAEAEGEAPTPTGGKDGGKDKNEGTSEGYKTDDTANKIDIDNVPATTTTKPEVSGDVLRDKIRTRLFEALCMARQEGVTSMDEGPLACEIEEAMFETLEGTSSKYKTKFQQLHFNLKDSRNPDLRRKVVLGEIDPKELLVLSPEELASDAKREENQRIRDKKLFDAAPSQAKKATTDQFQCGKCRQRKCTYYQMQTRSADEPMTTFVSCLNCGNRWKFC